MKTGYEREIEELKARVLFLEERRSKAVDDLNSACSKNDRLQNQIGLLQAERDSAMHRYKESIVDGDVRGQAKAWLGVCECLRNDPLFSKLRQRPMPLSQTARDWIVLVTAELIELREKLAAERRATQAFRIERDLARAERDNLTVDEHGTVIRDPYSLANLQRTE